MTFNRVSLVPCSVRVTCIQKPLFFVRITRKGLPSDLRFFQTAKWGNEPASSASHGLLWETAIYKEEKTKQENTKKIDDRSACCSRFLLTNSCQCDDPYAALNNKSQTGTDIKISSFSENFYISYQDIRLLSTSNSPPRL